MFDELRITKACAEAAGLDEYIELDSCLICWQRRDEAHPSVDSCRKIDKETGKVTEFSLRDQKIFRWTECVGQGSEFYVLKRDLGEIVRVNADTLEETPVPTVGTYPHHLCLTEDFLYYSTKKDRPMIVRVDLSDLSSAGMNSENESMDLKVDAWWPCGHMLYGMHDDFDREIASLYRIDMDIFRAEILSETRFEAERFWEKPELLKESYTFMQGDLLCTVVQTSRHSDCYYETVDTASPGPVQRRKLAGAHTFVWFADGFIYTAETEGSMTICRVDPATGEKTLLAENTHAFSHDEFGHVTGDRPRSVGRWLHWRDTEDGMIHALELPV